MATHVLTGATGFAASALALELLKDPQARIVAITRPGRTAPQERLRAVLDIAADAYAADEVVRDGIARRVTALPGNLCTESLGVDPAELRSVADPVDHFWHCAASLKFDPANSRELEQTNVSGTKEALALAKRLRAERFTYMSTAYVSGRTGGHITEGPAAGRIEECNAYERSKIRAEELVAEARGLSTRIVRPSIIIGHSETRATVGGETGFYGLIRRLVQVCRIAERRGTSIDEILGGERFRVMIDPASTTNLIPVDQVAREAVAIGGSDSSDRFFHLTNPKPPSVVEVLSAVFQEVGLNLPRFTETFDGFTDFELQMAQDMAFYHGYALVPVDFDRSCTDAVVGLAGTRPMDVEDLRAYAQAYVGKLCGARA